MLTLHRSLRPPSVTAAAATPASAGHASTDHLVSQCDSTVLIAELLRRCGKLERENQQLRSALDDALDREQIHALDADHEQLIAIPGQRRWS